MQCKGSKVTIKKNISIEQTRKVKLLPNSPSNSANKTIKTASQYGSKEHFINDSKNILQKATKQIYKILLNDRHKCIKSHVYANYKVYFYQLNDDAEKYSSKPPITEKCQSLFILYIT